MPAQASDTETIGAAASQQPHDPAANGHHKFVSFYLGGELYALHSSAVAEVTGPLSPTPLPDAPTALAGIAPLRGEIVAVIDLGLTPQTGSSDRERQKAIVLKAVDPDVEMPMAFNVDALGELVSIDLAAIKQSAEPAGRIAPFETTTTAGRVRVVAAARLTSFLNGQPQ